MGWVTDRHRCTLDLAFAELRDVVEKDVDEANGLLPESRRQVGAFRVQGPNRPGTRFIVDGFPLNADPGSDAYKFWFELHDDRILIRRTGPQTLPELPDLMVTQKWDNESATCVLSLAGRQVTVETISQIALEPLFFGV